MQLPFGGLYVTRRSLFLAYPFAALAALVANPSTGFAQPAVPEGQQFASDYKFVEVKEVKKVEWKASAAAGFTLATGNSNVFTVSGGASFSRNDGKNLFAFDVGGVYGLTQLPILLDRDAAGALCPPESMMNGCNGVIDRNTELGTESKTTAGYLLAKARYDRFFSVNNAGYLTAFAGLDAPANKRVVTGGQIGYSRQFYKSKMHEFKAELGADLTYTEYEVRDGMMMGEPNLFLASARLFLGYNLTLGENTQVTAKVESLINLNPATVVERRVAPADATRVNANLALTTKVWQRLSFRFSLGIRYDNCPAPNANLNFKAYSQGLIDSGLLGQVSCSSQEALISRGESGATESDLSIYRVKYNQKLDTLTEANLVFSFL